MFARFSTVGGEKGSADTARDPRGFALKFYTEEKICEKYYFFSHIFSIFVIEFINKYPTNEYSTIRISYRSR